METGTVSELAAQSIAKALEEVLRTYVGGNVPDDAREQTERLHGVLDRLVRRGEVTSVRLASRLHQMINTLAAAIVAQSHPPPDSPGEQGGGDVGGEEQAPAEGDGDEETSQESESDEDSGKGKGRGNGKGKGEGKGNS